MAFRRTRYLCATALLAATAFAARAPAAPRAGAPHIQTISYPLFIIYEDSIAVEVRTKLAYFLDIVDFQGRAGTGAGAPLAESDVLKREREMVAVVARAIRAEANDRPLEPRFDSLDFTYVPGAAPPAIDDATFRFSLRSPDTIRTIRIRYDLFASHDPEHRGIAKIRRGARERPFVFRKNDIFEARADDLGKPGAAAGAASFLLFGMDHIFNGYDHLLFLAGLLLAASSFRSLMILISAFTLAHSATLAAAAFQMIALPPAVVEPAIAASVLFIGIENLFIKSEPRRRWIAASAFGLVHGLGFAEFIHETALPPGASAVCLGAFNLGVEAGQATIVCILFPALSWLRARDSRAYDKYCMKAGSAAIAAAGAVWLAARLPG